MSCYSLSRCLGLLVCANTLWLAADSHAPLLTYEFDNLNIPVGDNDPSGVTVLRRLAPEGSAEAARFITDVNVRLRLVGGSAYNGDLYVYLQHGGEVAVLLNRVGRRTDNEWGYGDPGLDLTLDDQAPNGDIHIYRMTLFGNHDTPLGGPLTDALGNGPWQPDGRRDDPSQVLAESTARSALLSQFNGSILGGDWTLFVADLGEGGSAVLDSFAIDVELTASTSVVLYDFQVETRNGQVVVRWQTASEVSTLGFRLYRQIGPAAWTPVGGFIASQGQAQGGVGAAYEVLDAGAKAGETYTYKLVEEETSGGTQEYGPFVRTAQELQLVAPLSLDGGSVLLRWCSRMNEV